MAAPISGNGCMKTLANSPPQVASLVIIIKIKHFRTLESNHVQTTTSEVFFHEKLLLNQVRTVSLWHSFLEGIAIPPAQVMKILQMYWIRMVDSIWVQWQSS